MSPLIWFLMGATVLAALAFFNHKRTQSSVAQLENSGFEISTDFGGRPRLLLDQSSRQLAWVEGAWVGRAPLSNLHTPQLNWDAKPSQDTNYRIELILSGRSRPVAIHYPNEVAARQALTRLLAELP